MALGEDLTVNDFIEKMQDVFGSMKRRRVICSRFWTHTQGPRDTVASFATRLEGLQADLLKEFPGQSTREDMEQDLIDRFYLGLKPALRDAIRYRYERGHDYSHLLRAARRAEQEMKENRIEEKQSSRPQYSGQNNSAFSRAGRASHTETSAEMVRPAEDDDDEEEEEEVDRGQDSAAEEQAYLEEVVVKARAAFQAKKAEGKSFSKPKQNRPLAKKEDLLPGDQRRCFKCTGWGHLSSQCANSREIDLNQYAELSLGGETVLRRKASAPPKKDNPK
jgi:hypothetical protein